MKRSGPLLFYLLLAALFIAPDLYRQWRDERALADFSASLDRDIADSLEKINPGLRQAALQDGVVTVLENGNRMDTGFIQRHSEGNGENRGRTLVWYSGRERQATLSAPGLDQRHYFANSFLVGFEPFDTDRIWVPLYTLALCKHYQYDHVRYSGLRDIWQNSIQAWVELRGDCEDHAIILADWLISLGYDARVALGTYRGQGHAWVVLRHAGEQWVLEATSKRKALGVELFTPAALATDYRPAIQFNRNDYWRNEGSVLTTDYFGPRWHRVSRFERAH